MSYLTKSQMAARLAILETELTKHKRTGEVLCSAVWLLASGDVPTIKILIDQAAEELADHRWQREQNRNRCAGFHDRVDFENAATVIPYVVKIVKRAKSKAELHYEEKRIAFIKDLAEQREKEFGS